MWHSGSNVSLLFAAMLGMAACGSVEDVKHVNKAVECTYAIADGLDDAADTMEMIHTSMKSCIHFSTGGCLSDVLETTAEALQVVSALIDLIMCFHPINMGACASTSVSISGSILSLGIEIKDLLKGVCNPSKNVGIGYTTLNQTNVIGKGLCTAGIIQSLAALAKSGLGIALTVEICKLPDSHELCLSQTLEVIASVADDAAELVNAIAKCEGKAGFNAACGGAISGLVEDSLQIASDGFALSDVCPKKDSPPPLRLYDAKIRVPEKSQPQISQPQMFSILPWAVSGFLLLMMPAVFRAGKKNRKSEPRDEEIDADEDAESYLSIGPSE